MRIAYRTDKGLSYHGKIEKALTSKRFARNKGEVDLIFTSPPFPLNRKKRYGNLQGQEYVEWLSSLAPRLTEYLSDEGSIVIELGNAWVSGLPVMSTLPLEALLAFKDKGELYLCQQFVWNNPAKLPSPAQWVNVDRVRVKDSFTHIWWMSKTPRPKADNRKVLTEYSSSMKALLRTKRYNSGNRPSEHNIGDKSFLTNNKGAIPSNVLTAANTLSGTSYQNYCRLNGLTPHPARMPKVLPEFFIKFLTSPDDLILDPFGGSNTTGATAEELGRRWLAVEADESYILGSVGRFEDLKTSIKLSRHYRKSKLASEI